MFGTKKQPIEIRLDHPEWTSNSVWRFKPSMTDADAVAIAKAANKTRVHVDEIARQKAARRGEDYVPDIEVEELAHNTHAFLLHMSLGWEGDRFTYDPDADSPLAGQLAPCDLEHIGALSPIEVEDIRRQLNAAYAGRTPEDTKRFPDGSVGAVEPSSAHVDAGDVSA